MNKYLLSGIIGAVIIGIGVWAWSASDTPSVAADPALMSLAQCLTDKGVVMYGAEWCSHCKDQKALFGGAWSAVTYVECPQNTVLCTQKGVKGYPTWILANGQKLEGVQPLARLAQAADCTWSPSPAQP